VSGFLPGLPLGTERHGCSKRLFSVLPLSVALAALLVGCGTQAAYVSPRPPAAEDERGRGTRTQKHVFEYGVFVPLHVIIAGYRGERLPIRIFNDSAGECGGQEGKSLRDTSSVLLGESIVYPPFETTSYKEGFSVFLPFSRLGQIAARRNTPVRAYVLTPDADEHLASRAFCLETTVPTIIWQLRGYSEAVTLSNGEQGHRLSFRLFLFEHKGESASAYLGLQDNFFYWAPSPAKTLFTTWSLAPCTREKIVCVYEDVDFEVPFWSLPASAKEQTVVSVAPTLRFSDGSIHIGNLFVVLPKQGHSLKDLRDASERKLLNATERLNEMEHLLKAIEKVKR
jgi:hypothetical protein